MSIWDSVSALQRWVCRCCWCCIGGMSILWWSRVWVFVCATHQKNQSLGVKRICTTCIHNHIPCCPLLLLLLFSSFIQSFMFILFLFGVVQCDELGCAWSSSVKIYDYLCKRLLITAAHTLNKMKNWWRHAYCGAILVMKGVNLQPTKKKNKKKKLVWFIVFYWLIEWDRSLFPR